MPEKTVQKEPGKKPAPSKKPKPQQEVVVQISLSELHPFPDHPFQVREDASMQETAESVKEYGVLPWPRQRGDEDAVFLNAFGSFLHGRILPHLKGVIRERMQFGEWDLDDYFLLRFRLFGWHGLFARFFLRCFFSHRVPPVGI